MNITVVNNMGYALPNFVLTAKIGTTAVTATRQAGKIAGNNLLFRREGEVHPGDHQVRGWVSQDRGHQLHGQVWKFERDQLLPGRGGAGGDGEEDRWDARSRVTPAGLSTVTSPSGGCTPGGGDQARQLQYAAQTDFINVDAGLDKLMTYYCAGRASWNSGSDAVISTACTGTATDCTKGTRATERGRGNQV
jgi:hypothetical protein